MIKVILCINSYATKRDLRFDPPILPLLQYFVFSFISFLFVSVISTLSLCQILLRLQKLFSWIADWKWLRPSSTKHAFRCWNHVNIMLVRFACQILSSSNICSLTELILCNSLKSLVHIFWTDFSYLKKEGKQEISYCSCLPHQYFCLLLHQF